jgi:hypothetical protein
MPRRIAVGEVTKNGVRTLHKGEFVLPVGVAPTSGQVSEMTRRKKLFDEAAASKLSQNTARSATREQMKLVKAQLADEKAMVKAQRNLMKGFKENKPTKPKRPPAKKTTLVAVV